MATPAATPTNTAAQTALRWRLVNISQLPVRASSSKRPWAPYAPVTGSNRLPGASGSDGWSVSWPV